MIRPQRIVEKTPHGVGASKPDDAVDEPEVECVSDCRFEEEDDTGLRQCGQRRDRWQDPEWRQVAVDRGLLAEVDCVDEVSEAQQGGGEVARQ
jgi:hypothetical protein